MHGNRTSKPIYYGYFYSVVSYGMTFWGNCNAAKKYLTSKLKELE
jgi:hypothetical protein